MGWRGYDGVDRSYLDPSKFQKALDMPKVRTEASGPGKLDLLPIYPQYDLEEDLDLSHSSTSLCDYDKVTQPL
jgi:hypothetical protein